MKALQLAPIAVLLLSASAFATKPTPEKQPVMTQDQSQQQTVTNTAKAQAHAYTSSDSYAHSNIDNVSANNEGNSQVVNLSSPDSVKIRNTPGISLGGVYPANSCQRPMEASVSVPGFGIGGGAVAIDEVCQNLEWARVAYQMGLREAAVWRLCSMDQADGNPHCDPVNDYNREIAMLEADNKGFHESFERMQKERDRLAKENKRLVDAESERRMIKALSK